MSGVIYMNAQQATCCGSFGAHVVVVHCSTGPIDTLMLLGLLCCCPSDRLPPSWSGVWNKLKTRPIWLCVRLQVAFSTHMGKLQDDADDDADATDEADDPLPLESVFGTCKVTWGLRHSLCTAVVPASFADRVCWAVSSCAE
jgi:hypothetical protein